MNVRNIRIGTYNSRVEAELAVARLDAEGIQSRINTDDVAGAYPVLEGAGVYLFASSEDSVRAIEILANPPLEATQAPGDLAEAEAIVRGNVQSDSGENRVSRSLLLLTLGGLVGFFLAQVQNADSSDPPLETSGTVEIDRNLDGRIDAWHDYDGEIYVRSRYDDNFDGVVDEWVDYESGSVSVWVSDLDGNEVPDRTVKYRFDLPVLSLLHPNGGELEEEERFTDGKLREVYSVSKDGQRTLIRSYDTFGRLVRETP